jgi:hypothetical protein
MATKKTLYHSELAKLGPVEVEITTDLIESRYKKGTFIVGLRLDGEERTLAIENDDCGAALDQRKGQVLTIEASGSRESAEISILDGLPAAAPAPKARPAARTAPVARPAAAAARPAPAGRQAAAPGRNVHGMLMQLANLEINVQCLVAKVSDALIAGRDIVLTDAQLAGMAGRMFIEAVRAGAHQSMSADHMIDCTPKGGKAPAQQSEASDNDGGVE